MTPDEKCLKLIEHTHTHKRYWENPRLLLLGWTCDDCKELWNFMLSDIRKMMSETREHFRTTESRHNLTARMNGLLVVWEEVTE